LCTPLWRYVSPESVHMEAQSERRFVSSASGAIERRGFLRIAKALILGMRNSLVDPFACIEQNIIEELAAIVGMERCVIFKIGDEEVEGISRACCEMAAGVPQQEHGRDLHEKTTLDAHPDIKAALQNRSVLVIKDPSNDERTAYFREMIETKDISEIAYVPLPTEGDRRPKGVIVFDAVHGRSFTEDEITFCSEVAELLGLLHAWERIILQHFRDAIINKIVPLGGFARKLHENLRTTLDYVEIIRRSAIEIDSLLPKTLDGGL